ncbi:sensor histidine kinase [Micromonospora sp. NPDC047620]|uniref:sensor histidine kinase n=1 Tax=Micromonospora sp. NPDC047620 TaxID=3364251 RepID=UPI003724672C
MSKIATGVRHWGLAVCVAAMLLVAGASVAPERTDLSLLGYVLLAVDGLVLAFRRRAPVGVLVVTAACVLAYQALGFEVPPVALLFAVYAATRSGHRRPMLVVTAIVLAAQPFVALASPGDPPVGQALAQGVLGLGWVLACGAAGEALRQAEQRAKEAERTREEIASRRASEERLRIARELHDSLTHQISVIKVQAGVAVHLARKRGEEAPPALAAVEEAAREATRELRATLEALRGDEQHCPHGIEQIDELVQRARSTGVAATLTVDGNQRNPPSAVSRAAYRITQEALTNVARHAGPATASVSISYGPDTLTVRIDDDGKATPNTGPVPGVGLLGMRERVTALGGRLHAGPRRDGGFTVQATMPVDGAT